LAEKGCGAADILKAYAFDSYLKLNTIKLTIAKEHNISAFWYNLFDLLNEGEVAFL